MASLLASVAAAAVVVVGGVWLFQHICKSTARPPHPPGPRGLPFIGNMFQIPMKDEWPVYESWAKKYGPITYLTMLGTPMIVLNSRKVVRDLLEERQAIYSNRPLVVLKELCGLDWVLTYIGGEPHRIRRTTVMRYFSGPSSVKHRYHQQDESRILVANILNSPDNLEEHIKQHTSSSILLATYGYRVSGAHDPLVDEMERSFEQAEKLNGPVAFLVEAFPNVKKWPSLLSLSGLNKSMDIIREVFSACRFDPFMRSKRMINEGTAAPCFVSTSLDDIAAGLLSPAEAKKKEELVMDCASVMYGAATDSTSCTLRTFFALMALHPHVMKRAQAEIDSVCEQERLPTFDDWHRLPYINAIILEVLRYNTVTPLGLPHAVAQDDIYDGMLIPKGSMICANLWLMFRDPEIFENPDKFNPDRFLGIDGVRCREVMNLAWGSGRRSCPGRQFAEAALFIAVSTVIACFDMTPKATSTAEKPKLEFFDGFVRRPKPFPVDLTPRSAKIAELIRAQ